MSRWKYSKTPEEKIAKSLNEIRRGIVKLTEEVAKINVREDRRDRIRGETFIEASQELSDFYIVEREHGEEKNTEGT